MYEKKIKSKNFQKICTFECNTLDFFVVELGEKFRPIKILKYYQNVRKFEKNM